MNGKVAFEEHMALPETLEDSRSFAGGSGKWDEFARQILDIDAERLEGMERNGIDYTILSLNAPGRTGNSGHRSCDRSVEACER
jgi:2,3-dihydroxybenzoate decarboxylase